MLDTFAKSLRWWIPALGAVVLCLPAKGAVIVQYKPDGNANLAAVDASVSDTAVAADQIVAGAGLNASNGATWAWEGWNNAATDYIDWGFDVTSTTSAISLQTMFIDLSGNAGIPEDVQITMAIDRLLGIDEMFNFATVNGNAGAFTLDLGSAVTGGRLYNGDSVNFRLTTLDMGFGSIGIKTGSADDGIIVNGALSTIPEPSAQVPLVLVVVSCLIFFRHRRRLVTS